MKLALEEWWHLLEGAEHPVVIWIDHKNLMYLHSAKRVNAHQAHLYSFNVSISYRPVSRNIKPDALSLQFAYSTEPEEAPSILPANCKVGAVMWEVEEEINWILEMEPDPGTGPDNSFQLQLTLRSWIHKAKFACHPGRGRTSSLIKRHFYWDTLEKDV